MNHGLSTHQSDRFSLFNLETNAGNCFQFLRVAKVYILEFDDAVGDDKVFCAWFVDDLFFFLDVE